ncbi:MAG: hypothetical protein WCL61_01210, partial [bacterium]
STPTIFAKQSAIEYQKEDEKNVYSMLIVSYNKSIYEISVILDKNWKLYDATIDKILSTVNFLK